MAELLVDTDIFIDHLRGHRRFVPGEDRIFYSVLTRAELFAGRASEEGPIALILGPFAEIPIDRAIAEAGGRLRRDHALSLPDALIAATAIAGDLALVTRNTKGFRSVPGLRLTSPR